MMIGWLVTNFGRYTENTQKKELLTAHLSSSIDINNHSGTAQLETIIDAMDSIRKNAVLAKCRAEQFRNCTIFCRACDEKIYAEDKIEIIDGKEVRHTADQDKIRYLSRELKNQITLAKTNNAIILSNLEKDKRTYTQKINALESELQRLKTSGCYQEVHQRGRGATRAGRTRGRGRGRGQLIGTVQEDPTEPATKKRCLPKE